MFLTIHDIVALSGLSRAQISLMISRYGVTVRGRFAPGMGRRFVRSDALSFAVAGELTRLGLNQPRTSDALASLKGLAIDIYAHVADISAPLIVFSVDDVGRIEGLVVDGKDRTGGPANGPLSIVIEARPLLDRIKSHISGASA